MKNSIIDLVAAFLIFFFPVSCQKEQEATYPKEENIDLQIQVPLARFPLFADCSDYFLPSNSAQTKSSFDDATAPLISLLDLENKTTSQWKDGVSFTQIPFKQNEDSYFVATISQDTDNCTSDATTIKKFLIIKDTQGKQFPFVVTLISSSKYFKYHKDFDFLTRANFTGIALFSNLNGELLQTRSYRDGLICPAKLINSTDNTKPDSTITVGTVVVYGNSPMTKSVDEWITPAYCTAFRYMELNPSNCIAYGIFYDGTNWHTGDEKPSNEGGASSGGNDLSGDELPCEDYPYEEQFKVEISHYCPAEYISPDEKVEIIKMHGSGSYLKGTIVVVDYESLYSPLNVSFTYWTGDFEGMTIDMPFIIKVDGTINATAYFNIQKPCSDANRKITNPLVNMSIAASSSWGNYKGGTYGNTRTKVNGETKNHDGIDLAAPIGTPVYAIYSGFITRVRSSIPDLHGQPALGNYIEITSERDDNTDVILLYAHLQSGNAIAINPRTGVPFKPGDKVHRADIIGFTGRSGNAFEVPNKHLHLRAKIKNDAGITTSVNPANYINGTINVGKINSTHGKIDNIICN